MIIYMEKRVNRIWAQHEASFFLKKGFKVFLKNDNGNFILAVHHSEEDDKDYFSVIDLHGVKKAEPGNRLFRDKRSQFVSAEEYFHD